MEVHGRAEMLSRSGPIVMVAHFVRPLRSNESVALAINSRPSHHHVLAGPGCNLYAEILPADMAWRGEYLYVVWGIGGTTLASGQVKILE